jgi:high-affinity nickel-transport protein
MSFALLGLAFLLGIKHSYDADHLLAVGTVLHRVRSFAGALKVGASWAVGHMLTAGAITIVLFIFKDSVLGAVLAYFEMVVAVLLIVLGVFALRTAVFHRQIHFHRDAEHAHLVTSDAGANDHTHRYMFGVGVVHGLASNDELLTLLAASLGVATLGGTLLGIGVFSIGVILGMVAFCALFSIPWLRIRTTATQRILALVTGFLSIAYGISMFFGI